MSAYISIIVTTRNDNYGENMTQRLNMFVKSLDLYAARYPDLFELLIVEWNPPSDQSPLHTVLPICSHLPIRVITVPSIHHEKLGIRRPLAEWPAKNVGLRRANSPFVLITNPDVIFTPSLVESLAAKNLSHDVVYRCDRYDFDGQGIDIVDSANYVDWAVSKTFRMHGMRGAQSISFDITPGTRLEDLPVSFFDKNTVHTNGAGDFMLISTETAINADGFYGGNKCPGHCDSVSMYRFIRQGISHGVFEFPCFTLHHDHDRNNLPPPYDYYEVIATAHDVCDPNWGLKDIELDEWNNGI